MNRCGNCALPLSIAAIESVQFESYRLQGLIHLFGQLTNYPQNIKFQ
ncbi:hypothetical protein X746_27155 [Mesorhizobium sp. LNJC380A00]|nr:hypothetical protein X746_27155 [Mesorhizobium sp. LNJC380A00]ESZ24616.1 hypothetical protein X732_33385 [Mesorhizobium sp. L2C066B000]